MNIMSQTFHSVTSPLIATTLLLTHPLDAANVPLSRVSEIGRCLLSCLYAKWNASHDKRLIHRFEVGKLPHADIQLAAHKASVSVMAWMDIIVKRNFTVITTQDNVFVVDAGSYREIWKAPSVVNHWPPDSLTGPFSREVAINKTFARTRIPTRGRIDTAHCHEMQGKNTRPEVAHVDFSDARGHDVPQLQRGNEISIPPLPWHFTCYLDRLTLRDYLAMDRWTEAVFGSTVVPPGSSMKRRVSRDDARTL